MSKQPLPASWHSRARARYRQLHESPGEVTMRQSPSSVLPKTDQDRAGTRRPLVERIAGWSARHRKTAVLGWLAVVAIVFVSCQMIGSGNVPSYDTGQS